MELLGSFSKSLGYTTMGYWYHMPTGQHCGLSMTPILDDDAFGNFKAMVRAHQFREIEHLTINVNSDDRIAYIKHMLNMTIPREKMEDVMDMAKENVIAWKNLV
ncbi:unnamed protein product [Lactuca virosa]|uniref:Uncharacterized protein n=1 Tax=Lactuca virosa TaxID=75947 RepID=A0AAU9PS99_9ASTR|nr:unnamed protein product [Lactuca virosa]